MTVSREGNYTDDKQSGTWFSYTCPGHPLSGETRYDDQDVAIYGKETDYWPNRTTLMSIYVRSLTNGSYDFSATHYGQSGALAGQAMESRPGDLQSVGAALGSLSLACRGPV